MIFQSWIGMNTDQIQTNKMREYTVYADWLLVRD